MNTHDDERQLAELAIRLVSESLERGAQHIESGLARDMPHLSAEDRAGTLGNIRTNNALARKKIAAALLRGAADLLDQGKP